MGSIAHEDEIVLYTIDVQRLFKDGDIQKIKDEVGPVIEETKGIKLAIDFSQVEFVSSRGLGVLVALRKQVKQQGGNMALFSLNATIQKVLAVTRMSSLFLVEADKAAAIEALKNKGGLLSFLKK